MKRTDLGFSLSGIWGSLHGASARIFCHRTGYFNFSAFGYFSPGTDTHRGFQAKAGPGIVACPTRESGPLFPGGESDRAKLIKRRHESENNPDQCVRHTVRSGREQKCRIEKNRLQRVRQRRRSRQDCAVRQPPARELRTSVRGHSDRSPMRRQGWSGRPKRR